MKRQILLLNGPPRSGKDSLAYFLSESHSLVGVHSFKHKLISLACEIAGVDYDRWQSRYESELLFNGKKISEKDEPWGELPDIGYMGKEFCEGCGWTFLPDRPMSQRQFLAFVSEIVIKPHLGIEYFGLQAYHHCRSLNLPLIIFSDSGFEEEVEPFLRSGQFDVNVIQLHREGCSYSGDSRDYLRRRSQYRTFQEVHNNGSLHDAANEIIKKCQLSYLY